MGLHGVPCDAQSCSVAATGGVLIPSTGAQREQRSSGYYRALGPGNQSLFWGAPPTLISDGIYGSIIANTWVILLIQCDVCCRYRANCMSNNHVLLIAGLFWTKICLKCWYKSSSAVFIYRTHNSFAADDAYISLKETRFGNISITQSHAMAAGSLQLQLSAGGKRSAKVAYICRPVFLWPCLITACSNWEIKKRSYNRTSQNSHLQKVAKLTRQPKTRE